MNEKPAPRNTRKHPEVLYRRRRPRVVGASVGDPELEASRDEGEEDPARRRQGSRVEC